MDDDKILENVYKEIEYKWIVIDRDKEYKKENKMNKKLAVFFANTHALFLRCVWENTHI